MNRLYRIAHSSGQVPAGLFWVLGVVLFAFLFAAGCSKKNPEASAFGDTLIFARGSDSHKLDPADVDDGESVNVLTQICEGLVRFKSGTLEIEPALAESYDISEDGLVYRFTLREGVTFHDGEPLTAEAAAYSFLRQMDPEHPGHLPEAAFVYWNYLYQDIAAIEVTGPMELQMRLSRPNASLLYSLAVFPAYLISPKALDTHGDQFHRHPEGTGPYKFVEWRPNEAIILQRNDNYWGEKPHFKRLVIKVVPDSTVRLLQLKSGEIHGMDGLQPTEIETVADDENLQLYRDAGLNMGYLAFNLDRERMTSRDLRQAIALAIDRETLARIATSESGRVAQYPLPPGFLGYPKEEQALPYNPDEAKALTARLDDLLQEPLALHVMNAPRPYLPDPVVAATYIKGQLEAVGIPVKVVTSDFKAHLSDLRNGDFDMGLIGWVGDNGDSDNFLSIFFGSWAAAKGAATNFSFYRNDAMDELLLEAREVTGVDQRSALYEEALALWKRDLPLLPLTHGDNLAALRSGLAGFELQKIGELRLGWIYPE